MSVKAAFVTGGGGYVGSKLCCELVRRGYSVTAFDLNFQETEGPRHPRITKIQVRFSLLCMNHLAAYTHAQGDIRDAAALRDAVEQSGARVLFHIASYGMSGKEQVDYHNKGTLYCRAFLLLYGL